MAHALEEGEFGLGPRPPQGESSEVGAFDLRGDRQPGQPQQRGHEIGRGHAGVAHPAGRNLSRPTDQQRNAGGFLIKSHFEHPAMGAELFAMVGAEHHDGVVLQPQFAEAVQDSAHVPIEVGRHGVIDPHKLGELRFPVLEPLLRVRVAIHARIGLVLPGIRQRELDAAKFIEPILGHILGGPRIMRRAVRKHERKRLARAGMSAEPLDR